MFVIVALVLCGACDASLALAQRWTPPTLSDACSVQRAARDLVGADSCVVVAMRTCFAQHRVRRVLRRRTFAKAVRRVEDGLQ